MIRCNIGSLAFAFLAMLAVAGCGGAQPQATQPESPVQPDQDRREPRSLESYLEDNPRFEPLAIYAADQPVRVMSRPVGMLRVWFPGSKTPKQCTAILADSAQDHDLILTARHCFENAGRRPRAATLTMGFYDDRAQGLRDYEVDPVPMAAGRRLDYALAKVGGSPIRVWGSASFTDRAPQDREQLLVIHHPGAQPKRVTRYRCLADAPPVQGKDLRHLCDTVQGSSGAPVFSNAGSVIALHYAGFEMGEPTRANYAVLVRDIFSELSQDIRSRQSSKKRSDPDAKLPESFEAKPRQPSRVQSQRGVILFPEIVARRDSTNQRRAGIDCRIVTDNPLVSLKVKPDRFAVDIRRIPVASYQVMQKKLVRTPLKREVWYRIELDGQRGWVVGDNWSIGSRKGSECL
ncbi:MAG: serine protease [Pseudomonadota bacterium]